MLYSINKRNIELKKVGAILLAIMFLIITAAPAADAQWRYHRRPSKTKHIAIGTAAGAVGGGLIGGGKGSLIGAGAGAGVGYGLYKYKKRKYNKQYYY
jgi:hypothetical protein